MKSRFYILILVILLIISAGVILLTDRWSTTGNDFESLVSADQKDADRIILHTEYDTLVFKLIDAKWYYGNEELNQQAVENLLLASGRLSMKSIRPLEGLQELNYAMELLLMNGNNEICRYTFIRAAQEYYIFSGNSKEAFGVELRGFEHMPLEKIFSSEADHYRKHLLLSLMPSEIKEIGINPLQGQAFRAMQDNDFNIRVTDLTGNEDYTSLVDERKMRLLFSYFNSIRYNEVYEGKSLDSGTKPSAVVQVEDFNGNSYRLDIYQWLKPGETQADIFEALVHFNGEPETLKVDYYCLDLLIRDLAKYRIERVD